MHYPEDIDKIVKSELSSLIEMKKNNEGPFKEGIVDKYYDIYEKMKKN